MSNPEDKEAGVDESLSTYAEEEVVVEASATVPPPPPPPPARSAPIDVTPAAAAQQSPPLNAPATPAQSPQPPIPQSYVQPAQGYAQPAQQFARPGEQYAQQQYAQPGQPYVQQQVQAGQPYVQQIATPPYQPQMVAAPSAFTLAFKNLWVVLKDLWSGRVDEAFQRPAEVERRAGKSAFNWLIPFVLNSLLFGAVMGGLVSRSESAALSILPSFIDFGLRPSDYFKVFFWTVFLVFCMYMLLVLANLLSHRISGADTSFSTTADALAVANTALWLPLVIIFFVVLLFPPTATTIIVLLSINGLALMMIVLSYVGVQKNGPHRRSPAVPFAWLTLGAWLVELLVVVVLLEGAFY